MDSRRSAEQLRKMTAGFALVLGSFTAIADPPSATPPPPAVPATAVSTPASGSPAAPPASTASAPGHGTATTSRHHRHSRHSASASSTSWTSTSSSASSNALVSSWPSLTHPPTGESTPAGATAASDVATAGTAAAAAPKAGESLAADWMPSSSEAPPPAEANAAASRLDVIAEKIGKQAFIDFNSRVQEPNGVVAFRAIDSQTGELQTVSVDKSGEVRLKAGWPH